MKTIAICNHKGGVGKTALSMAIAEGLHRKGKRTLLVDLDQQMNATQQAKIDTTDEVTVYDLLTSFDYTAKDISTVAILFPAMSLFRMPKAIWRNWIRALRCLPMQWRVSMMTMITQSLIARRHLDW